MKKLPFNCNDKWTASQPLELIHSDVGGPIEPTTHDGYCFWITFIDDHTCYPWIFFLKKKSDAFSTFRTWKKHIEAFMDNTISELRFSDNWIRFLWSDGGEEYNSDEFCDYICNNGIVHKTTAANTAKSNGLAECMNQMIVFHAVSMLIDSKLPKSFWGEAFHTATYLIAWSPAAGLKGKTQYKVLTGRRVDPTFFWPFGCIEFALVDKYHHKKLDSRAHKGIMLGYEYGKKAYKLLDVSACKIFSS